MIGVVIPALRADFASDLGALSWAIPAYMLPFAGLQLISGAISDATSRRLALGIGFLGFALSSVLCGLAPDVLWFLIGRVGQGAANAFTTAVLTAALADLVPRERLGRAIGVFSSVNVGGSFMAPMVGGLLATANWRLAYAVIAAASAVLWLLYDHWLRALPRRSQSARPSVAELAAAALDRRLLAVGLVAVLANFAIGGSSYLWPTYLHDRWALGLAEAGAIASAFGLAGALAAPIAGRWCDRRGPLVVASVAAVLGAIGGLALATAPTPALFLAALTVQGLAHGSIWTAVSSIVMFTVPDPRLRGTAASVNSTFKFGGTALAPAAYTPAYAAAPTSVFGIAAVAAITLAGLVGVAMPRSKQSASASVPSPSGRGTG
jgi:MFS family permease